tara:strand:+ start:385 stop:984 length:600 start_codon:yes stop_codon:yes gene_type:complete
MNNIPKNEWIYNWGINSKNAEQLYNHILKTKPKIILETGTFEGQATYVMANACNNNNNKCIIYTIDYNGDPTLELNKEKWLNLEKIRNNNLEKIKNDFKNVEVKFIEGDSREVLKTLFSNHNINNVDLFYQDSMHFIEGIQAEWNLVESYINTNSFVIFDDLSLKGVQKFRKWFINKYQNKYDYKDIKEGHKQFIVKKN